MSRIAIVQFPATRPSNLPMILEELGELVVGRFLYGEVEMDKLQAINPDLVFFDFRARSDILKEDIETIFKEFNGMNCTGLISTSLSDKIGRVKLPSPNHSLQALDEITRESLLTLIASIEKPGDTHDLFNPFRHLLESSSEAVLVVQENGKIVDGNLFAANLFGDEAPLDFGDGDHFINDFLWPLTKTGSTFEELLKHHPHGEGFPCRVQIGAEKSRTVYVDIRSIPHSETSTAGTVIICHKNPPQREDDIDALPRFFSEFTYEVKDEAAPGKYYEIPESVFPLAALGVMSQSFYHAIQQPLNAIQLGSDGMLYWQEEHPGLLPEVLITMIRDIQYGTDQIMKKLDSLQQLFLVDLPIYQKINLNDVIARTVSIIHYQLNNLGYRLEFRPFEEPLFILADPNRLHLLMNTVIAQYCFGDVQKKSRTNNVLIETGSSEQKCWTRISVHQQGKTLAPASGTKEFPEKNETLVPPSFLAVTLSKLCGATVEEEDVEDNDRSVRLDFMSYSSRSE